MTKTPNTKRNATKGQTLIESLVMGSLVMMFIGSLLMMFYREAYRSWINHKIHEAALCEATLQSKGCFTKLHSAVNSFNFFGHTIVRNQKWEKDFEVIILWNRSIFLKVNSQTSRSQMNKASPPSSF